MKRVEYWGGIPAAISQVNAVHRRDEQVWDTMATGRVDRVGGTGAGGGGRGGGGGERNPL
jgi:hypothetical protein